GVQDAKDQAPSDTTRAGAPHPDPLPNGERGRAESVGISEGPTSDRAELINETRRWWRFAPPWMIMTVAGDFFFDIDLLLLSPLMSIADLAVFGVCTKLFALIAFAVSAVYAVMLPDMFAARRQDDPVAFQRKVITANLLAGAIALGAGVAMLASGPLLALFGPQFAAGAVPLAILCAGLALRSVLGPSALVLSLHDRPWTSLWPVALGLVLLVLLNRALVPSHGLLGAALAAAVTVVAWSALQWLLAFRHTGTDVSIWPWLSRARF
ncbi:polysaccharide biosynthesis C-terminal domain-containing protein, partial [Bradyrhizobium sp. LHD-71]|uniref:lipopolysaccharide biosynthesis protein n=1 Tax=Bradyrhizobium sp. LHD-71 TaxID=3072141 RepID=UPI00280FAAA6